MFMYNNQLVEELERVGKKWFCFSLLLTEGEYFEISNYMLRRPPSVCDGSAGNAYWSEKKLFFTSLWEIIEIHAHSFNLAQKKFSFCIVSVCSSLVVAQFSNFKWILNLHFVASVACIFKLFHVSWRKKFLTPNFFSWQFAGADDTFFLSLSSRTWTHFHSWKSSLDSWPKRELVVVQPQVFNSRFFGVWRFETSREIKLKVMIQRDISASNFKLTSAFVKLNDMQH